MIIELTINGCLTERASMLLETLVKIDDQTIGHITPQGRYLDRAAFLALRPTARLRAYLGLIAPRARAAWVLARVCRVSQRSIYNLLKTDVTHGRVYHLGDGFYALARQAHPTTRRELSMTGRQLAGHLELVGSRDYDVLLNGEVLASRDPQRTEGASHAD